VYVYIIIITEGKNGLINCLTAKKKRKREKRKRGMNIEGKGGRIFRSSTLPSVLPPHSLCSPSQKRVTLSDALHAIHSPPQADPMQGTPTREPPCSGPSLRCARPGQWSSTFPAACKDDIVRYDTITPHRPGTIIRRRDPILI
jgi:hypothetical protein